MVPPRPHSYGLFSSRPSVLGVYSARISSSPEEARLAARRSCYLTVTPCFRTSSLGKTMCNPNTYFVIEFKNKKCNMHTTNQHIKYTGCKGLTGSSLQVYTVGTGAGTGRRTNYEPDCSDSRTLRFNQEKLLPPPQKKTRTCLHLTEKVFHTLTLNTTFTSYNPVSLQEHKSTNLAF